MAPEMVGFSNGSELAMTPATGMEDDIAIPLLSLLDASNNNEVEAGGVLAVVVGIDAEVVVDDDDDGTVKPLSPLAVV